MIKFFLFLSFLASCNSQSHQSSYEQSAAKSDSLEIIWLIEEREKAMIEKDISTVMGQFSEDATWINSQGYYFEGKAEIEKFHNMLSGNDTLDYFYQAGTPKVRMLDDRNALAYYAWKMYWYRMENPSDTTFREIGLMTLSARKSKNGWSWIAVTNQHTPWFYNDIDAVSVE